VALSVVVPNTWSTDLSGLWSSANIRYAKLTGDSSYFGASGYPVTPGTFGFTSTIVAVVPLPGATPWTCWYDPQSKGLRIFLVGAVTATEVVSGSSLTNMVLDVAAWGF